MSDPRPRQQDGADRPASEAQSPPAIELRDIDKSFGPVRANKNVCLSVRPGAIHGIIGENGAGKSTLMSILYGFYEADRGEILIGGKQTRIRSSRDAIAAGIGMVHQHFMLVDNMSVVENIMLGAESGAILTSSVAAARAELERLERDYNLDVDPDALAGELPVGQQQRVEILKALYRGAEILILDEPTGVLTPQETEQLFRILDSLRKQGVTIVLITHKLREIMAVTDDVSVMRGGEMIAHRSTAETSKEELAELMVGRKVLLSIDKQAPQAGATVLAVEDLSFVDRAGVPRVDKVSFAVRAGEIVGIAGVSGNGQSELLELLSGIKPITSGGFSLMGERFSAGRSLDPAAMRDLKVAHVPEDRLRSGLVRTFAAEESAILGYHRDPAYTGRIFMDRDAIQQDCARKMADFDVRPQNPNLKTANFSGGNQQKLVLAREISRDPRLLLVGQPTRGVDIGAIEFIHRNIVSMRDAGSAVLLVSVELDEIMSLSDRILVMFEGRIVGEVPAHEANERLLGLMMANAAPERSGVAG
ncbi:ABC transporter ATP-binding protein [Pelagibius litoralis]|uniref:ABC transporter ATP-binding protein n=1 Tax=Pelagibius litoralis TaxID=374515 RepID=A0A967KEF8_9PROT|nr:ABC transporter ATP-binding protein [Pelagibius litoralis]NIA70710.1 ABC transporter ATP-binding protein [Pelagibius litoralis]